MTIEKSYGEVEIDGVVKRMSDLTDEEFTRFMRSCATRLQRAMQDYINQHPEEYEQILTALADAGAIITSPEDTEQAIRDLEATGVKVYRPIEKQKHIA